MPAKRLVSWGFSVLKSRLPEAFYADLFSAQPFFINPNVTGSKVVRADAPGEEPDIGDPNIRERFSSHGGADFKPSAPPPAEKSATKESAKEAAKRDKADKRAKKLDRKANDDAVKARQKAFGTHEALKSRFYEPGVVYTFEYFDSFSASILSPST